MQWFKQRVFGPTPCKLSVISIDGFSLKCYIYFFLHQLFVIVDLFFIMSAQASQAAPARTGKDAMDCHLLSLFMNAGVPETQIDAIGDFGVTNIAMFTHLANGIKDTDGMRQCLKTIVGLNHEDADPRVAVKARLDQARILAVYTAACTSNEIEIRHTAERQVAHQPPEVTLQELDSQRRAFESRRWKLDDAECPSKTFYERKLGEATTAFKAESLTAVTSLAQEEAWQRSPAGQRKGIDFDEVSNSFRQKKNEFGVNMPKNSESLRARLKLLGMCFEFARMKYSSKRSIQTSSLDMWTRYTDYLFGKECWGLATKDEEGRPIATPTLKHVLIYDMAARSQISTLMNDGADIMTAFQRVCGWASPPDPICSQIRQVHFLNHVSIEIGTQACRACTAPCYMDLQAASSNQGTKRKADDDDDDGPGPSKQARRRAAAKAKAQAEKAQVARALQGGQQIQKLSKSQKKKLAKAAAGGPLALTNGGVGDSRQGKGAGKAAGKGKGPKWHTRMPEDRGGKSLCFGYSKGNCTRPNCQMEHACQICFGPHPAIECPKKGGA